MIYVIYGILLAGSLLGLVVVLCTAQTAGRQARIITVFKGYTAEPLTALELSIEAGLSLEQTRKTLNELDKANRLRQLTIDGTTKYLYV